MHYSYKPLHAFVASLFNPCSAGVFAALFMVGTLRSPGQMLSQARILSGLADGTPAPKSESFRLPAVAATDIVSSKIADMKDHRVVVQEVSAEALPFVPPPGPPVAAVTQSAASISFQKALSQARSERIPTRWVMLNATVYHSPRFPNGVRSCLVLWSPLRMEPVIAWTGMDANYLSGFSTFQGTDGQIYDHFFFHPVNIDLETAGPAQGAMRGRFYQPPDIPALPADPTKFVFTSGTATEEDHAALQALYDVYTAEFDRLRAAFLSRQAEQLRLLEEASAPPPKPEDSTFRFRFLTPEEVAALPPAP